MNRPTDRTADMPQSPDSSAPLASRRSRRRGSNILELTLLIPWYAFLFVGALDWGYYARAMVSTEAAVRAAALYTSKDASTAADQVTACIYALNELKVTNNVPTTAPCTATPIIVTASLVPSGADGQPATAVTVRYQTINMIPIPGFMNQQFWISKTIQMRLRN